MASSRGTTTNESAWNGSAFAPGVDTLKTSGGDYTSLSTWEGDTDGVDLTATNAGLGTPCCPVLEIYVSTTANALNIGTNTTSSTYFRVIRATSSARHGGDPSAGVTLSNGSTSNTYIMAGVESDVHIADLKVAYSANTASAGSALSLGASSQRCVWAGLLLTAANAGGVANGIVHSNAYVISLFNNIVYKCDDNGIDARGASSLVYNSTVVGCGGYGFTYTTTACVWKNNIAQSNTGGDYNGNGNTGTTHNLASDTTAPETGTYWDSKTVTFVNAASDDYRLTNDADAVGQGADLSATFDDDIAYTTRPSGSGWDLGAFEYIVTAGGTVSHSTLLALMGAGGC